MDTLNTFLRLLAEYGARELTLIPNKIPTVFFDGNNIPISSVALSGIQINTMIFPVIPPSERQKLSGDGEAEFPFNNGLGDFTVHLKKTADGFLVTVKPGLPADVLSAQEITATVIGEANSSPAQKSESVPTVNSYATNGAPLQQQGMPSGNGQQVFNVQPVNGHATSEVAAARPSLFASKFQASGSGKAKMDMFFRQMAELKASDLHLSSTQTPMIRKDGRMMPLDTNLSPITPEVMRELLGSIMPEKNQEEFERRHDTDFAYEIKEFARFRANIFMDRKGPGAVFRIIPSKILTAEQLGLSKAILDLCYLSKGLVVVTGPTGSGKSTTLCAMVDFINKNRDEHLITIEDPIEFTHENNKCLVNQREVHNHTDSFKDALRAALREDPDILLVGEMRDLETISIAIETAETGHLVFGTLHTTTAASTVDRIIDQFPADRQQQIRVMLSESLKGVIAQTLLPKKGGGRVAALEVLIVTPAISNLIREGKTFQIPSAMQTGKNYGMALLNDSLIELVKQDLVEPRDAYVKAVDKPGFEMLLTRNSIKI